MAVRNPAHFGQSFLAFRFGIGISYNALVAGLMPPRIPGRGFRPMNG